MRRDPYMCLLASCKHKLHLSKRPIGAVVQITFGMHNLHPPPHPYFPTVYTSLLTTDRQMF